ncbi:hypothetical protein [Sinorhizobium meliloti]|uniref:hypothetical protein n=1 Tax=Rhizobium meliloti TaxID=382 RepID=UPI00399C3A71
MVTKEGDQVITGYRDHGLWHAPERRHGRAHRTPRRTVEGQGGSMHMFSKRKHFYGATASLAPRCRSGPERCRPSFSRGLFTPTL